MANLFSSTHPVPKKHLFCNRKQGAAMLLLAQSQREDTVAGGEFAEWMVEHIDRWFSFAKRLRPEIERMEDIILVTGRHRTKSWANVVFEENWGFHVRYPTQAMLPFPGSPSNDPTVLWQFSGETGQTILNIMPNGKVRPCLPYTFGRHFICMDSGPIYGHMRIYPGIPCHSHPTSVELV